MNSAPNHPGQATFIIGIHSAFGLRTAARVVAPILAELRLKLAHTPIELIYEINSLRDLPNEFDVAELGLPITIAVLNTQQAKINTVESADSQRIAERLLAHSCRTVELNSNDPLATRRFVENNCHLLIDVEDARLPKTVSTTSLSSAIPTWTARVTSFDESSIDFSIDRVFPELESAKQFDVSLAKLNEFNREVAKYSTAIQHETTADSGLIPANQSNIRDLPIEYDLFRSADYLARRRQSRTLFALRGILVAVFTVAVLFQLHVRLRFLYSRVAEDDRPWFLKTVFEIQPKRIFLWIEDIPYLVLLIGTIAFYVIVRRQEVQQKYLQYRGLAEALRVQFYWTMSGITDSVLSHAQLSQDHAFSWITLALRPVAFMKQLAPRKRDAASRRLALEQWVHGQTRYYVTKSVQNNRAAKRVQLATRCTLYVGFALLFVRSVAPVDHLLVISLAISIAAGLMIGVYGRVTALAEHAAQYSRMASIFEAATIEIEGAMDRDDVARADSLFVDLGKRSLAENAFWLRLHSERPIELPRA